MAMTLRVFIVIGAMIVGILTVGCGGDDEADSPVPTVEKAPELTFGLDGDIYRNRRLFKVSNLPVDDWTVKEVTNTVHGEVDDSSSMIFNEVVSLLLMQPTSEENFANAIVEAAINGIPYIYIWIEIQSVTDEESPREIALNILEGIGPDYEQIAQGSIFSKDRRAGYFWEIIFRDTDLKTKQSFFVRSSEGNRYVYRLLFVSPASQYDTHVSVYDKIVSSVEFRL